MHHRGDSGVKPFGAYSPPDRLRLRIVEMAGTCSKAGGLQRSPERAHDQGGTSRIISLPRQPGDSTAHRKFVEFQHLKRDSNVFTTPEIAVYESPEATSYIKVRDKIDLDLPRDAALLRHQHQHQQQQLHNNRYTYYKATPPEGPPPAGAKERASVWLMRRVKQRHPGSGDVTSGRQDVNNIRHLVPHPPAGEPTKRVRVTSGAYGSKRPEGGPQHASTHGQAEEADVVSLGPTTHFPPHGSAKVRIRVPTKSASKAAVAGEKLEEARTVKQNADGTGNPQLSALTGNALATPPPRQGSASRKTGMFTASLEAFKRRLRLSANKYSSRLHNDEVDRTEEYLIRPEPPEDKPPVPTSHPSIKNSESNGAPALQPKPPAYPRPLSEVRRHSGVKSGHINRQRSATLHGKEENGVTEDITDHNNNSSNSKDMNNNSSTEKNHNINANKAKHVPRELPSDQTPIPAINEPLAVQKNPYRNLDGNQGNHKYADGNDTSPFAEKNKHPLPSVKTYVVMNALEDLKVPAPPKAAPLTEHNLRLHDSLQGMLERRAKRMARFQRRQQYNRQLQQQQQDKTETAEVPKRHSFRPRPSEYDNCAALAGDSDSSAEESMNNSRVRRWVMDVSEQSVLRRFDDGDAVGGGVTEVLIQSLTPRSKAEQVVGKSAIIVDKSMVTPTLVSG